MAWASALMKPRCLAIGRRMVANAGVWQNLVKIDRPGAQQWGPSQGGLHGWAPGRNGASWAHQDLTQQLDLVYMVDQPTDLFMASNQGADRRAVLNFEGKRYDLSSMPDEMKRLVKGLQTAEGQLKFAQDQLRVIAVGRQVLASQLKRKLSEIDPLAE